MGGCASNVGAGYTLFHTCMPSEEHGKLARSSAERSFVWRWNGSPNRPKYPCHVFLWWWGPESPDLETIWRVYVARFSIEHTFRFFKQVRKLDDAQIALT
jgi:hypothetical protein